ncbi:MAG: (Fe-S)-binding protein [Mailhella sp.]|nr:(Fe-S)-binding protein [Mailhella sp.]
MNSPSCEYCGRCLSVCPSYRHHLVETMGPGERYRKSIAGCLQCLACTEICAKGVDGAQIILDARLAMGTGPLSAARRLERFVTTALLPNRALLAKSLKAARILQKLLRLDGCGSIRHMPDFLEGLAGKRSIPALAPRSIHDLLPARIDSQASVDYKGDVALFTGCFGGLVNIDAALAVVDALTARGYTVYIPAAQSCCGAPAQLSGFRDAFGKAQAANLEAFTACGDMPVLTMCATCHRTLRREYSGEASWISERVIDAAAFIRRHDETSPLHEQGAPSALPAAVLHARAGRPVTAEDPLVVAVHDPCHFRLDHIGGRAVRAGLTSEPWRRLVERPDPGSCCGGGGRSSLKNHDVADGLGKARAEAVLKSGADIVTAQCPGCVLQLNNHLHRMDGHARACHTLELLGR